MIFNDTAEITAQGIIYRDKVYTCATAIKEQWFLKASYSGPKELVVTFVAEDFETILAIEDGREIKLHSILIREVDNSQRLQYFEIIEIFKECRKKMKRRAIRISR